MIAIVEHANEIYLVSSIPKCVGFLLRWAFFPQQFTQQKSVRVRVTVTVNAAYEEKLAWLLPWMGKDTLKA